MGLYYYSCTVTTLKPIIDQAKLQSMITEMFVTGYQRIEMSVDNFLRQIIKNCYFHDSPLYFQDKFLKNQTKFQASYRFPLGLQRTVV